MPLINYYGTDLTYEIKNGKAHITEAKGGKGKILLPDSLEDFPVAVLSRYSLSNLREAEEIVLPEGLEVIESLAFYNDRGLLSFNLPKTLYRIGGDAFKNCDGIKEVTIGSPSLLRYVLDELTQEIIVNYKEGEKTVWRLLFPIHAESFSEDVPGRAFHRTFTGPGYTYRKECGTRTPSLKRYDSLFKRALEEETEETLSTLAACRLLCPFELEETAKAEYESYLREHAEKAAKVFIDKGSLSALYYMTENKLIDRASADNITEYARKRNAADVLAALMDYKLKSFTSSKKTFEL